MSAVDRARSFAAAAYGSADELDHPNEVAKLVAGAGGKSELQTAAVLHDVVEDTVVGLTPITLMFGSRVAAIVAAMTEDDSIKDDLAQKAEHRERARDSGREVALLFVADKLSNARRMRRGTKEPDQLKVGHYATTLEMMRAAYPDLPLLDELGTELDALRGEIQRSPA